jgi:hypothetical protein
MTPEPRPHDARPAAGATPVAPPPDPHGEIGPAASVPSPFEVEIRNLDGGQTIEMDVRGTWTEDELEARLLRFVSVRQPAVLHLRVEASADGGGDDEPRLARPRAAIEAFGGSLTVSMTPSVTSADGG